MRIGQRLASLVISDIRSMSRACDAVGGINLGQGICDLPTPPPVAAGAKQAIDENRVIYSAPEGILPLRQAIAKKVNDLYGLAYDPLSEVVVTAGATGGFAAACLALFDPGDEIILFEPYYGYAGPHAEARADEAAGVAFRPDRARRRDRSEDTRHRRVLAR
jgi:aminotransferase